MDPARWLTVCAVFHEALEQAPENRGAFVRDACRDDADLTSEVGAMLDHHSRLHDFLEQPAPLAAADVLDFEGAFDLLPGRLIAGRYRIHEEIGRGGFGVVYRAADERLHGRVVAVKVLHAYWAASGWMRHRFEQEVEALSRLSHPGIVSVTDFGETDEPRMFLVMEWLEGPTLRALLAGGPLERARAAEIIRAIGEALEAAHSAGLLHRDLKPENIIVGKQIKIVDFGVARVSEASPAASSTIIAGTPDYMAPEQVLGQASRSSDIYALARIAEEIMTGQRRRRGDPLPKRLSPLIREGLQADPARRPQSALVYANALAGAMLKPPAISRRTLLAGGGAGCVVIAASVNYLRPHDLAPGQKIVEIPGIYPEEQYGCRPAYDIHSVIVTNEANTGRDRRRIWSSDMGEYCRPLTREQKAQAWRKGFRLSAQLLPEEGLITVLIDLAGVGPRFDLVAVQGSGGETLAGTVHQIVPTHNFDLYRSRNRAPRLTLLELVMDPKTKLARVLVDGEVVTQGYAGHRQFQEDLGLTIAVGRNQSERAAGVYRQVRLEIFS